MKKLLKEFKEFAIKGNVLDLAVAVVLGAAFNKVVTAIVEIFLNPIIESLPKIGEEGGSAWTAPLITFAAVVVEFLLTALVLFIIVKAANKAKSLAKKKEEEAPAEPTTKVCPFCQSEISIKATRCPNCTSELKD